MNDPLDGGKHADGQFYVHGNFNVIYANILAILRSKIYLIYGATFRTFSGRKTSSKHYCHFRPRCAHRTWLIKLLIHMVLLTCKYILSLLKEVPNTEAYSAPCQTCKMELLAKIVNG